MTNVYSYLIIMFIFFIGISAIVILGNELKDNENSNLDNDSLVYIYSLNGINYSQYTADKEQIEKSILFNDNSSQGNPKDEGLEFLFVKEKGSTIEIIIKGIYSLPQTILSDIFRLPFGDWSWIIDILNWLWRLSILIAVIYFVRGIIEKK